MYMLSLFDCNFQTTIPHSYATMNCNVGPVAMLRKQLMNEDNVKVSVNDFIIKSAALALQVICYNVFVVITIFVILFTYIYINE